MFQADLVDLKNYSRENSGFRYIHVIINCFKKFERKSDYKYNKIELILRF